MANISIINQRYGLEVNGGSEYFTRLIAEKLTKNHSVEVLTTCAIDHMSWENYYNEGVKKINNVSIRRFPVVQKRIKDNFPPASVGLNKSAHIKSYIKWLNNQGPVVPDLIEYVKKNVNNYDVFIPMTYLYYPSFFSMPYIANKAIFIPTAHNEIPIYFPIYKRMFGSDPDYPKPAYMLFLTEQEKVFIHNLFKNNDIPFNIAGVGVDIPDNIDKNDFKKKYSINDDFCVYIGRIDSSKNCDALFMYFKQYKKRFKNKLKLILIGKNSIKIPKHKDIIHLGFISEKDKLNALAASKLLLINSILESLSIVVLEAFALGIPVLANGNCAVIKDHCIKSNAGLYYNGYFEFEGALNYILTHKNEYNIMSKNGVEYVKKNYDWDIIMNKFENAINFVLEKMKI